MSKMKTRKAVMNALKGVPAAMLPEPAVQPHAVPLISELEPEMPVDAFFAAPANGGADAMGLAGIPWGGGWAPSAGTSNAFPAPGSSTESWNVRPRSLQRTCWHLSPSRHN